MPDRISDVAWSMVPDLVDQYVEKTADVARVIQDATVDLYTRGDVGFYWNPCQARVGLCYRGPREYQATDIALAKMAMDRAVGPQHLSPATLGCGDIENGSWVKVAYSPTLRRLGEVLNFFPGKYPGGYPNAPSPLAATLTGGLVGAGLGYGAGWLGEQLMPDSWDRGHLRKTLAMLGGGVGAAPGSMWMLANYQRGKPMTDGSVLADPPGTKPQFDPADLDPIKAANDALDDVQLGERYTEAVRRFTKLAWSSFAGGYADPQPPTPLDVNINKMGQTLWEVGADPRTAATTMGALYAAQQMPDSSSRPGVVTPHQVGLLGTMMGAAGGGIAGYAVGLMAGKALGLLTGMPAGPQNTLKNTGAVLGIVNAVVPRLFH